MTASLSNSFKSSQPSKEQRSIKRKEISLKAVAVVDENQNRQPISYEIYSDGELVFSTHDMLLAMQGFVNRIN